MCSWTSQLHAAYHLLLFPRTSDIFRFPLADLDEGHKEHIKEEEHRGHKGNMGHATHKRDKGDRDHEKCNGPVSH